MVIIIPLLLAIIIIGVALFLKQKTKFKNLNQQLEDSKRQLFEIEKRGIEFKKKREIFEKQIAGFENEKEILNTEREKIADKNKKMWAMNEAVYKEKRRVDEELEKLNEEKLKLEQAKNKLDDKIKKLWQTSTAVHKEKENIRTIKIEIERKHQEIVDSVTYAQRIQEAILPSLNEIETNIPKSFILFKPRDIVSGDFYWFSQKGDESILACVDCTGHGVPGAFMSMIGNTLLNQIVNERNITRPDLILNELNKEITASLKQDAVGSDSRDGMDIGVCNFNFTNGTVQYAAANRPLYFVRSGSSPSGELEGAANVGEIAGQARNDGNTQARNDGSELVETKANKVAIGGHTFDEEKKFTNHVFELKPGDTIYLSSDGYADQFSPNDKKLMTKRFKEILVSIQHLSMPEQGKYLDKFITDWRSNMEQTDDVLVIGVRV